MKAFGNVIVTMGLFFALLASPRRAVAADFHLEDGPDLTHSPAIVVRNSPSTEPLWDPTSPDPPGPNQAVVPGQTNYVWVKVGRDGAFIMGETAWLKIFVARGCETVAATELVIVADPPVDLPGWDVLQGDHVLPLRYFDGESYHDSLALSDGNTIDGGTYWYRFTWEASRIPDPGIPECTPIPSLLAWVDDDADPTTGGTVAEDDNLALRYVREPVGCECGDGIQAGDEACDGTDVGGETCAGRGYTGGTLLCNATCDGFDIDDCESVCGNGTREVLKEECDDGNTVDDDGCSSTCRPELGWTCDGTRPSVCSLDCGNGTIARSGEECDDGNLLDGDGCSSTCSVEPGWTCDGTSLSVCSPEEEPPDPDNDGSACGCNATPTSSIPELVLLIMAIFGFCCRRRLIPIA